MERSGAARFNTPGPKSGGLAIKQHKALAMGMAPDVGSRAVKVNLGGGTTGSVKVIGLTGGRK